MTSCVPIIGQTQATPTGRVLKVTTKAEPGAKSDVYDCIVIGLQKPGVAGMKALYHMYQQSTL